MSALDAPGNALSSWMRGDGPSSDVVLSSRIRLARNMRDAPYPPRLDRAGAEAVVARVAEALRGWTDESGRPLRVVRLDALSPLERQVMVEKHLTSPAHVRQAVGALALSEDESVSVMILEEDHVRIQCLAAGLQLRPALDRALRLDAALAERLPWAFDAEWGHLTTCPTNVGTGLRASVMVHLPGLAMANQIPGVLMTLSNNGMTARGLYGEGSESAGNLFQISNAQSLGRAEGEIVQRMEEAVRQLAERERSVRERLLNQMGEALKDRIWRAYGVLAHARRISSAEAMELLSLLRLGIDLHILPQLDAKVFNELIVATRPAFLQHLTGQEAGPEERDVKRASLIRAALRRAEARAS